MGSAAAALSGAAPVAAASVAAATVYDAEEVDSGNEADQSDGAVASGSTPSSAQFQVGGQPAWLRGTQPIMGYVIEGGVYRKTT